MINWCYSKEYFPIFRFLIPLRFIRNDNLFIFLRGKRWWFALSKSPPLSLLSIKLLCHSERSEKSRLKTILNHLCVTSMINSRKSIWLSQLLHQAQDRLQSEQIDFLHTLQYRNNKENKYPLIIQPFFGFLCLNLAYNRKSSKRYLCHLL